MNGTHCIINNGNIPTDGMNKRKYLQRKYDEMWIYELKYIYTKNYFKCVQVQSHTYFDSSKFSMCYFDINVYELPLHKIVQKHD